MHLDEASKRNVSTFPFINFLEQNKYLLASFLCETILEKSRETHDLLIKCSEVNMSNKKSTWCGRLTNIRENLNLSKSQLKTWQKICHAIKIIFFISKWAFKGMKSGVSCILSKGSSSLQRHTDMKWLCLLLQN